MAVLEAEVCDRFLTVREKRQKMAREVASLENEEADLGEKIREFAREKGGRDKTTLHAGFIITLGSAKGAPAWKQAFVKELGNAAAEKVIAATPPRETLLVQRAE